MRIKPPKGTQLAAENLKILRKKSRQKRRLGPEHLHFMFTSQTRITRPFKKFQAKRQKLVKMSDVGRSLCSYTCLATVRHTYYQCISYIKCQLLITFFYMLKVHPAPTGDGRLSLSTTTPALLQGCQLSNSLVARQNQWHGTRHSTLDSQILVKENLNSVSVRVLYCKQQETPLLANSNPTCKKNLKLTVNSPSCVSSSTFDRWDGRQQYDYEVPRKENCIKMPPVTNSTTATKNFISFTRRFTTLNPLRD